MTDTVAHIRHLPIREQLRYCRARYVWPIRHQPLPNPYVDKNGVKRELTWAQWFEQRDGMSIDAYLAECRQRGLIVAKAVA